MIRLARLLAFVAAVASLVAGSTSAQSAAPRAGEPPGGFRSAYIDGHGVIRWRDDGSEVRLFGANYTIASSLDFRAAGYVGGDRKRMIDEDVAHFARMGWNGMRLAFWGDWQNSDLAGNLIPNAHLDLLDYLIARARERGIYILFNPIHTYDAGWPDAMGDSFPGFSAHIRKDRLGTDPAAIAAQVNYLRQILNHVNPYTGLALRDEPSILFIEMINEPIHHPEDLAGSVRYIDALADAVRSTGSRAILVQNVSQDFRIAPAVRRSRAQAASFGWYPTGLNSGHELAGNTLRTVDDYPALHDSILAGMPRLVYEFDSADQLTGYMYPAMVRTFRQGGVQFAAMFAYDMLETASRNLGWTTHRLNLVYTPRKAMSAVIAAEAMRRLPSGVGYGRYPRNTRFGDFRVSYDENLGEMVARDAFLYTGDTRSVPPAPAELRRIAGHGSSPVVRYAGEGIYFLDRVRPGVWRLEVYPDAVDVDEPFAQPRLDRIVTRAIYRAWPMRVELPDLGRGFTVQPVAAGSPWPSVARDGEFTVRPGVYVLSAGGPVEPASLPARIGAIGFAEFHAPSPDPLPPRVVATIPPEHVAGRAMEVTARVVTDERPDSVTVWVRRLGTGWFRAVPMHPAGAYDYRASIPADALGEGPQELAISVRQGDSTVTFPEGVHRAPSSWDFHATQLWRTNVVGPTVPLRLLRPGDDVSRLAFSRIGDGYREGIFRLVPSPVDAEPALHLELPVGVGGIDPEDYTTSLVVRDRIAAREETVAGARGIRVRLRGVGPRQRVWITLMEKDGTSWSAPLDVDSTWQEPTIPIAAFRPARGVKLPQGFPGTWNYWVGPAEGRGGPGDAIRLPDVERLQLSLRREPGVTIRPHQYGVEVQSVSLVF